MVPAMTNQPKKRPGPKPSGRPPKRPMSFTVSEEHRAWLDRIPPGKRSDWLAHQIDSARSAGVVPEEWKPY